MDWDQVLVIVLAQGAATVELSRQLQQLRNDVRLRLTNHTLRLDRLETTCPPSRTSATVTSTP